MGQFHEVYMCGSRAVPFPKAMMPCCVATVDLFLYYFFVIFEKMYNRVTAFLEIFDYVHGTQYEIR